MTGRKSALKKGLFGDRESGYAWKTTRMTEPERSLDRRPVLALVFEPRTARSQKLWRRVFLYYVRHAERVWRRPDLRDAVRHELLLARAVLVESLSSFEPELLATYEGDPVN